jgi:hypothetical protein
MDSKCISGPDANLDARHDGNQAPAEAIFSAVKDLVGHHKRGDELGDRHITGDLTGLLRLKSDLLRIMLALPGHPRKLSWLWTTSARSVSADGKVAVMSEVVGLLAPT